MLKDLIQDWCNENQQFDLCVRLAFVPDEELEKYVLFETPDSVRIWLDTNGY